MLAHLDVEWTHACSEDLTYSLVNKRDGEWSTVMRAYFGLCDLKSQSASWRQKLRHMKQTFSRLLESENVSSSLSYMLVLLPRNEPWNVVENSGNGEGLVAWRRLVQHCDSAAVTPPSGLLVGLMKLSVGTLFEPVERSLALELVELSNVTGVQNKERELQTCYSCSPQSC